MKSKKKMSAKSKVSPKGKKLKVDAKKKAIPVKTAKSRPAAKQAIKKASSKVKSSTKKAKGATTKKLSPSKNSEKKITSAATSKKKEGVKIVKAPGEAVKPISKSSAKKLAVKSPLQKMTPVAVPKAEKVPQANMKSMASPIDAQANIHSRVVSPQPSPVKQQIVIPKPANTDIKEAKENFRKGDFVVYPVHGVGKVLGVEKQEVSGFQIDVVAIYFEKDRMTLRIPILRAQQSGLRKLSSRTIMDSALQTLKGRSRVKRTMWSRRAQEYEAKINSGDPVSIAEVVRDLHRNADQPDQSYSERQIYQAALERLVREVAAIEGITETAATERLNEVLKAA